MSLIGLLMYLALTRWYDCLYAASLLSHALSFYGVTYSKGGFQLRENPHYNLRV